MHYESVAGAGDDGSGNYPRLGPYVAVIPETEYGADVVDQIISYAEGIDGTHKVEGGVLRGILVLNSTAGSSTAETYASPEPTAPQGSSTPSSSVSYTVDYAWNANGGELTNKDMYGIPQAYVSSESVSSSLSTVALSQSTDLSNALAAGNSAEGGEEPVIVAEFNYYMGPDDSHSKECLEWEDSDGTWRPKCLPLGGNSVWSFVGSPPKESSSSSGNDAENNDGRKLDNAKDVILLGTGMDATSMFHDVSPGANSAASNILTLLLAAKMLGTVPDATYDALPKRIVLAFFQGESYGYIGSRSFLKDLSFPGFQCDEGKIVPAVQKEADKDGHREGCLHPMRPDLDFLKLGSSVAGMIAVDQVGVLDDANNLFVNSGGAEEGTFEYFLSGVLASSVPNGWTVAAAAAEEDDDGNYPYPPTPLSSLLQLSGGNVGGVILGGYDAAYAQKAAYHSHLDSNTTNRPVEMDSIAASATILARAAIAAAYDDGDLDSDSAAAYALTLLPDPLTSANETLLEVADCLLTNGNCDLFLSQGKMERTNHRETTGMDLGMGVPLGSPPSYYTSVYDASNGQAFVQVGTKWYGSYEGDDYGKERGDAFAVRPSLLEMSVRGLLDDYLGRGSAKEDGTDMTEADWVKCDKSADCDSVPYCNVANDRAVCTGSEVCVCSRSRYHTALDEAIVPAPGNTTGHFLVSENDEGLSAMYTEPYWSSSVGVRVYRDGGSKAGRWALGFGFAVGGLWVGLVWSFRRRLMKEKLY